jgi:lysophospholipase L1-like esterase
VVQAKLVAVAIASVLVGSQPAPKHYYLALGDSIAFGMQPDKNDAGLPPSGFNTGFVDVLAARLRKLAPKIKLVNYGCPGESAKTFVAGGCPWLVEKKKLHDPFPSTQSAAALAFLRAHPGQVSPITITLGGNDINEVADACQGDLACIKKRAPAEIRKIAARLAGLLRPIRAAAPKAEIVLTGLYDFNADDLKRTDPLFEALNAAIARVAAGSHAHFADLFPAFNPKGDVKRERARICAYTFICSHEDAHPTNAGYRAIADAVWKAAHY